jgi:hypothetical protein
MTEKDQTATGNVIYPNNSIRLLLTASSRRHHDRLVVSLSVSVLVSVVLLRGAQLCECDYMQHATRNRESRIAQGGDHCASSTWSYADISKKNEAFCRSIGRSEGREKKGIFQHLPNTGTSVEPRAGNDGYGVLIDRRTIHPHTKPFSIVGLL